MNPEEFADEMCIPMRMSVASRSNSGKTLLLSQVIMRLMATDKIYLTFVFSNTSAINGDYDWLPAKCCSEFNPAKLTQILAAQGKVPKDKRKQILVILDDVLGDKSAENNAAVMKFYSQGRHYNVSIILMSQVANRILSPAVLQNSCYILYSRLNRTQLGNLYESVSNMDKKQFIDFSEKITVNFTFVIIDNNVQSTNPRDFLKAVRSERSSLN